MDEERTKERKKEIGNGRRRVEIMMSGSELKQTIEDKQEKGQN